MASHKATGDAGQMTLLFEAVQTANADGIFVGKGLDHEVEGLP